MMHGQHTQPENDFIIQTMDLYRTYLRGSHREVAALRGASLWVRSEQFVAIKVRSGSGKTTLLNCIGGLDRPTSGIVRVFGQDIFELDDTELTLWRREQLGFVFQSFGLTPTFSAYENVELMMRIAGVPARESEERARHLLDLVGLQKWMDHRPDELSGGQQQRVAIARALANRPRLILADEPMAELDSNTAREILSLFKRIVDDENVTMLIASHDPLVDEFVDRVFRLVDGKIVGE
jgi:putative ABC transport system ATP-binding protein